MVAEGKHMKDLEALRALQDAPMRKYAEAERQVGASVAEALAALQDAYRVAVEAGADNVADTLHGLLNSVEGVYDEDVAGLIATDADLCVMDYCEQEQAGVGPYC